MYTEVLKLPFGGPAPILTPIPGSANPNKIHIKYPLANIHPSPDNKFGAILAAGWREPVLSQGYRQFSVTFDSIKVNKPLLLSTWKLAASVNGNWVSLLGSDLADVKSAVALLGSQTINLGQKVTVTVPDNGELKILTSGWRLGEADHYLGASPGFLSGIISRIHQIDQGQPIGIITDGKYNTGKVFTSASNFGVGSHDDLSVENPPFEEDDNNRQTIGDFNLRYHIVEVGSFPKGQPNPEPKVFTVTPLSLKLVDTNGLSRSTDIHYSIEQFTIGRGFFYPSVDPETTFKVSTGSEITLPSNAAFQTSPAVALHLKVQVDDYGLPGRPRCMPRGCNIDPDLGPQPAALTLDHIYNAANNYGQGIHTERSNVVCGGIPTRMQHCEYFETTYRIDVKDFTPP